MTLWSLKNIHLVDSIGPLLASSQFDLLGMINGRSFPEITGLEWSSWQLCWCQKKTSKILLHLRYCHYFWWHVHPHLMMCKPTATYRINYKLPANYQRTRCCHLSTKLTPPRRHENDPSGNCPKHTCNGKTNNFIQSTNRSGRINLSESMGQNL